LKPVGFGYAKSLVDEFAEAESPACSAALAGVTSIIECPDQFPAISLKDLLQLLTAAPGPQRKILQRKQISAFGVTAEVTGARSK
jgi:hypothetical protein